MKFYLFFIFSAVACVLQAQDFDTFFEDATLRLDYIFSGNSKEQHISIDEKIRFDHWAGRRNRLSEHQLAGNGKIVVKDRQTESIIYTNTFSTLFQEWQNTEEASHESRSFQNTFLIPFPRREAIVEISLTDSHNEVKATLSSIINPSDILIRQDEPSTSFRQILSNGPSDKCIDVVFVAEGYTEDEMERFYADATIATEALFSHEPFKSQKKRFNIIAAHTPSVQSGISHPKAGQWLRTAVQSHFDTFYSDRYLTTLHVKQLHNLLTGLPYEHIIILANTEVYGGGGIYNSYTLTAAHHPKFRPVIVHEFGHSFGGLADEYYYDDEYEVTYPAGIEPWEPNITTLTHFEAKWKDLVDQKKANVLEGAGYQSKGVYRAFPDCRMKTNECEAFCPVCQRALTRLISFYTE